MSAVCSIFAQALRAPRFVLWPQLLDLPAAALQAVADNLPASDLANLLLCCRGMVDNGAVPGALATHVRARSLLRWTMDALYTAAHSNNPRRWPAFCHLAAVYDARDHLTGTSMVHFADFATDCQYVACAVPEYHATIQSGADAALGCSLWDANDVHGAAEFSERVARIRDNPDEHVDRVETCLDVVSTKRVLGYIIEGLYRDLVARVGDGPEALSTAKAQYEELFESCQVHNVEDLPKMMARVTQLRDEAARLENKARDILHVLRMTTTEFRVRTLLCPSIAVKIVQLPNTLCLDNLDTEGRTRLLASSVAAATTVLRATAWLDPASKRHWPGGPGLHPVRGVLKVHERLSGGSLVAVAGRVMHDQTFTLQYS